METLEGIRVIDLGGIGPGPFACGLLADMGALVVRVERPCGGAETDEGLARIGVRKATVVELDLKQEEGREHLLRMIPHADVLVEGFRPGVAERLGVGPEAAQALNPRLVYTRITGWGQTGPYAGMAGHDINYIGLAGVLAAIGTERPTPPLNLVADYCGGGMVAVLEVLAALLARSSTGRGRVVDVAMVDGAHSLLRPIRALWAAGQWREGLGMNLLDGGAPFYRTYRTADGGYVAVGALEDRFYLELVRGLGLDASMLPDRHLPGNWKRLATIFAARFAERSRAEWAVVFDGTDACVTPVLTMAEAEHHPHNRARRSAQGGSVADGRGAPAPSPTEALHALGVTPEAAQDLLASGAVRRGEVDR